GQVFHGFHQQLNRSVELDHMQQRLRRILVHVATDQALNRYQQADLRWLVPRLVKESRTVIQARARSERDVKSFLKTGLAAEHHRVGQLLNELLETALDVDWSQQSVRRLASVLPPVAVNPGTVPVIERLRFKSMQEDEQQPPELLEQHANLDD